jgi:succinate dehydrogenase / fumarate reductase, membrane anchor subunit
MVKSVLGTAHQGLTDWVIQRLTAIIMTIYTIGFAGFFLCHPNLAYYEWHSLFTHTWMKVATLLVFLSIYYHAWVGIWTVLTDYIKVAWLNLTLQAVIVIALLGFSLETLLILWGI